jgi:hypothetical protein
VAGGGGAEVVGVAVCRDRFQFHRVRVGSIGSARLRRSKSPRKGSRSGCCPPGPLSLSHTLPHKWQRALEAKQESKEGITQWMLSTWSTLSLSHSAS